MRLRISKSEEKCRYTKMGAARVAKRALNRNRRRITKLALHMDMLDQLPHRFTKGWAD